MIDATVKQGDADFNEATRRLTAAMKHAKSAERCGDDAESAYILLYSAVHKALTATLISVGLRIEPGERGHVVLIDAAKDVLGKEHVELLNGLHRARRKRNDIAYETASVSQGEFEGVKKQAHETLGVAGRFVQERKREHEERQREQEQASSESG